MKKINERIKIRLILIAILTMSVSVLYSQDKEDITLADSLHSESVKPDSLHRSPEDSVLIENLMLQIQELKLNEILIRNEYDKNSQLSVEADSIKEAKKRQQIDSLRNLTPGIPLVVEGDTLFMLYTRRGGVAPRQRVEAAQQAILDLGNKLTTKIDTVFLFDSEYTTDIMSGDRVIITITDQDGLWQNMSRQQLAAQYLPVVSDTIHDLQAKYGLFMRMKNIGLSILVIIFQIILIWLTNRLFRKVKRLIVRLVCYKLKPISIKDYEFLDTRRQGRILFFLSNVVRLLIILIQLLISIPILFSIFPETKELAYTLFTYIWNPSRDMLLSIGGYMPKLFQIIVIVVCFRYLAKGVEIYHQRNSNGQTAHQWFLRRLGISHLLHFAVLALFLHVCDDMAFATQFGFCHFSGGVCLCGARSFFGLHKCHRQPDGRNDIDLYAYFQDR